MDEDVGCVCGLRVLVGEMMEGDMVRYMVEMVDGGMVYSDLFGSKVERSDE